MKISAKGRYALGLMLDLATYNTGEPIALKDIAKRQDIPEKYLEQVVAIMNKAGYVRSVRGANGGYLLRVDPKLLKVSMILEKTEADLIPTEMERDELAHEKSCDDVVLKVYDKLNEAIIKALSSMTLYDMLEWNEERVYDYCI